MKYTILAILAILANTASAHEFTPTYPELKPSYVRGVLVTTMRLFNRREDVQFYELSVHDAEWNPIPFATTDKIIKVDYLSTAVIDIYIRQSDEIKVEYICSTSKLRKEDVESTGISSRICSRVK